MSKRQIVERSAWGIAGLLWLVWLGFEDRSIHSVLVVAAAVALAVGTTLYRKLLSRWPSGTESGLGLYILSGGIAGALVSVIAVVLMLVKVSLHNHVTPDFTLQDISAALQSTPAWFMAGLLLGSAAGVTAKAFRSPAG